MSSVSSPCIGVCTIADAAVGAAERRSLCLGCGRTIDEVLAWGTLEEPRRRAVMAELPARLAAWRAAQPVAEARQAPDAGADHP